MTGYQIGVKVLAFVAALMLAGLFVPVAAAGEASLTVEPTSTVSSGRLAVIGEGFGASEGVDIFFDAEDQALRITDPQGSFAVGRMNVPDTATPGVHWVTALGRRSGVLARVKVRVAGTDDWLQPDMDGARTSWNPNERAVTSGTVGSLTRAWSTTFASQGWLGGGIIAWGETIVVGGSRTTSNDRSEVFVAAVDAAQGDVRWERTFTRHYASLVGITDEAVIATVEEEWREKDEQITLTLDALDLATGSPRWSRSLAGPGENSVTGSVIGDGVVYVATRNHGPRSAGNSVHAVKASDGAVLWRVDFDRWIDSLSVADGVVLVAADQRVIALDATSGAQRWRLRTDGGTYVIGITDGIAVFQGRSDGQENYEANTALIGARLTDGRRIWTAAWDTWLNSIVLGEGRAIVAGTYWESGSGQMWALDLKTGEVAWKSRGSFWGGLAGSPGLVFSAGSCTLEARDAITGERVWAADDVTGPLAVVNGRVVASSCDQAEKALIAFEPAVVPAPKARALTPDATLQPDRGIEAHESLSAGWGEVSFAEIDPGDTWTTETAEFHEATYVGISNETAGGGLFRSDDGQRFERVGKPGLGRPSRVALEPVAIGDLLYVIANDPTEGLAVLRSVDGENFELVADGGFGDIANASAVPYAVDDRLLLGVENERTGAQLWTTSAEPSAPFVRVLDVPRAGIEGFVPGAVTFDGATYIGTTGPLPILLRTDDGRTWGQVGDPGSFRAELTSIAPQVVFDEQLYVAASAPDGVDVLRTADGNAFEPIVAGGFGTRPDANIEGRLAVYDEALYLATSSLDPRREIGEAPIEVAPEHGFGLWRSTDGVTFERIGRPGFDDPHNTTAYPLVAGATFLLAVGNYEEGDAVYLSTDGLDWEPSFREASISHGSHGIDPTIVGAHVILFHGDQTEGLTGWRSNEALLGEGAGSDRTWLIVAVVIAGLLLIAGLRLQRRNGRRRREPPTYDPDDLAPFPTPPARAPQI